jgi:hypothetical protein
MTVNTYSESAALTDFINQAIRSRCEVSPDDERGNMRENKSGLYSGAIQINDARLKTRGDRNMLSRKVSNMFTFVMGAPLLQCFPF